MKTRFKFTPKTAPMHQSKWTVPALVLTATLAGSGSALAQDYVTGMPTLSNINPSGITDYAAWASQPPTVFTYGSSGLEVSSLGYGSLYYAIPAANQVTLHPNDTEAVLTMTVNNVADAQANVWMGIPFILNDLAGNSVTMGGYTGSGGYVDTNTGGGSAVWSANGDMVTETINLNEPGSAALLASIKAGGDVITGFNLELDPATYPGGLYDVTFNSLALEAAPEPTSLTLLGIGFMGLMAARRRK